MKRGSVFSGSAETGCTCTPMGRYDRTAIMQPMCARGMDVGEVVPSTTPRPAANVTGTASPWIHTWCSAALILILGIAIQLSWKARSPDRSE